MLSNWPRRSYIRGPADPPQCRLCGAGELELLGVVCASDYFAGRVLSEPIAEGRLWRCVRCNSLFRHPILAPEAYLRLYEAGAAEQWSEVTRRSDLQKVRSIITSRPRASAVLDVGCGTGDFLASLPGEIAKYGIEPSTGAAAQAAARGITMVGLSLEQLPATARFDVITIIDVVEHLPDPAATLDVAFEHLCPDGMIIVSTGDPQCAAWRLLKSRFWYSSYPEHVSFPSRRFFERWQGTKGQGSISSFQTRYCQLRYWQSAFYAVIQAGYLVSPRFFHLVGRFAGLCGWLRPQRQHFSPGIPGLFVDHQVVTIRRGVQVEECANRKSA